MSACVIPRLQWFAASLLTHRLRVAELKLAARGGKLLDEAEWNEAYRDFERSLDAFLRFQCRTSAELALYAETLEAVREAEMNELDARMFERVALKVLIENVKSVAGAGAQK